MKLFTYLSELLGERKAREITRSMKQGKVVLVKGEQGTGKTTLVNILNAAGYHAVEDFDVCEITLDEPLTHMIPDFAKSIS